MTEPASLEVGRRTSCLVSRFHQRRLRAAQTAATGASELSLVKHWPRTIKFAMPASHPHQTLGTSVSEASRRRTSSDNNNSRAALAVILKRVLGGLRWNQPIWARWDPSNQSGGRTETFAAFSSHRAHLSRSLALASEPGPHALANSAPDILRAAPHPRHSMRTLAPNRIRSAVVRMCLVDIHEMIQ